MNDLLRNPLRVLNHLPLAAGKLELGTRWGLAEHPESGDPVCHRAALSVLDDLVGGRIDLEAAVATLGGQAFADDMARCYPTGLLELHITDVCDLDCAQCHYRSRASATLPFSRLGETLASLRPLAITITGGGEPNCYRSEGRTLDDVVCLAAATLPDTRMGLINNNTHLSPGTWTGHIAWQRSSLDAATSETYRRIKRRDTFHAVVENIMQLLRATGIPHVGVGFLTRPENAHELFAFLYDWYRRIDAQPSSVQDRFNIQFRPLAPDIEDVARLRAVGLPLTDTERVLLDQVARVRSAASSDHGFSAFVATRTNIQTFESAAVAGGVHLERCFTRCFNALVHRVLRATGDEYPDFLLCNLPSAALGNTLGASPGLERVRVGMLQFYYFNCRGRYCSPLSCRQGWVNQTIERHRREPNLEGTPVPEDPFF